jgi:hypothetical protein
LPQIAQNMDEFERQLNDLDMQGTMINATMAMGATSTPVDEVDSLIAAVADEAAINLDEAYVLQHLLAPATPFRSSLLCAV